MSIRAAIPDDALAVARVHVRAWQVGYRGLLPDDYLDALRPEERAARYTFGDVDPARPATMVAVDDERDGRIIGFATTGPARDADTPDAGELLSLHVDPDRWGRGVGRALVAAARAALAQRGRRQGVLWVMEGNQRAARLYAGDGWAPDGTRRTETVWGVSVIDRRYRRALP
jgi:ribosomal protein S18 acetylase RimI-like enzyme